MASVSTIANRRFYLFDKLLEIRPITATALSATGSETGIAMELQLQRDYKVVLDVAAYTSYAAGTAQWVITVEVSATSNFASAVTVGTFTPVGTATRQELVLSGAEVEGLAPTAAYIRTTATKTGTPGTLTYGAWICPSPGM